MKRKINLVGQNTLTISLPASWVRKQQLSKGDELEIIEREGSLLVNCEYKVLKEKLNVDISNQESMASRIAAATYKAGYDEVIMHFSTDKELQIIQDTIDRSLAEFDIVDYSTNRVKIKTLTHLDPEKFDVVFKRVFFSIKTTAEELLSALKKQNLEELPAVIARDRSIDKYSDFCRRVLNKNIVLPQKRTKPLYYLIEQIEIIGDMYKKLSKEIFEKKLRPSKEMIDLLVLVNEQLFHMIDIIFKFDIQKIRTLGINYIRIEKKIDRIFTKVPRKDLKIFFHLVQIFHATFEMKGALLTQAI